MAISGATWKSLRRHMVPEAAETELRAQIERAITAGIHPTHIDAHMAAAMLPELLDAARPRHPQRPPGAQAGGQLAAQRSPALHIQRLVDGFVADAHGLIVREVEPQAAGDLFRAPGRGPPSVLPPPVPATLPRHARARAPPRRSGR